MTSAVQKQIEALRPLTDRLRKTDCATRPAGGGKKVAWTDEPLTKKRIIEHLTTPTMYGCCPIDKGGSTTSVAVLDMDDHDGNMAWDTTLAIGESVSEKLSKYGLHPTMFRSSGGKGLHLIMLWQDPQDAASVRAHLANIIAELGYADGAGGLLKKEIEIFPKQDSVALDGKGNYFWLPFGRKSRLIDSAFGLIEDNAMAATQLLWEMSAPVPVNVKRLTQRDSDDLAAYMAHQPKDFTLEEIQTMLDEYPAELLDHDLWCEVGMALHHQFVGGDEGFQLFKTWSAKDSRPGMYTQKGCQSKWVSFGKKTDQVPVTLATLKERINERRKAYAAQLLKTGIVRDLDVIEAITAEIKDAPDLETLLHVVIPKVKGLKGLTPDDSETLAQITKKAGTKLGQPLLISNLRPKFVTNEQLDYETASDAARIGRIVGDRKHIRIFGGNMGKVISECAELFHGEVFAGGAGLVRPGVNEKNEPELIEVNQEWLRREVTERVAITKVTKDGEGFVDFPEDQARVLLRGAGDDAFLKMDGLAAAPFMREDGTICSVDGYDEKSRTWLRSTLKTPMPTIPDHPTKENALESLEMLLGLVADFPFVDEVSKAAWVADLLGAIARPGLPTCPGAVYTAPVFGTGKSMLMQLTNLIAYGYSTTTNYQMNEEEIRKLLTSTLKRGQPFLSFDNFPKGTQVGSAVMAGFLTSPVHQDRLLGSNDAPSFKNRTRITMTGNNITATGDLARRFLNIPLMVKGNKETRTFAIDDILGHVMEHRGTFLAAALTILRAAHIAKDLPKVKVLPSFEAWSHRVQKTVVWVGLPDPVGSVKVENDGSDEVAIALEAVRKRMEKVADHGRFGAKELWVVLESSALEEPILEAMQEANGGIPIDDVQSVGYWLKSNVNMTAGRYRLKAYPKKVNNRTLYYFEEVAG